ncbi:glycine cleavage system protein GcvH [Balneolaceae bacterium YR4-1]|uniref:Glycine cleavage system H protein n=1 Tax=Halalkalibaculum roseum TaxID=2709311 RepID=A0A6M1T859_9BACT|nr:glycine cleavage system protein GcvH [Halalkalibaculum roseum]NGP76453.1 glycine cleavage system protein GcvH [Halalkalibaculum roseum]
MSIPKELKYTKEHEWIRDNGDGTATVGITDFAQGELGDIVFVELEEVGFEFDKDESFGTVEAVKTVSELFAPVSGELTEINDKLEDEPELVNDDPYGDGWMIKLKISDTSEMEELMSPEEYEEIIA